MSALAGLWNFGGGLDAAEGCERVLAAQASYGPHDSRTWSSGPLAVGRRLYRTLPEDRFDAQPLRGADDRLVLVADVRLDNRDELASALDIGAGAASALCDAAVLLACLERWGEGALDRIVGDFAFALWNARERTLTLARDFLGQRPLHYHRGRDFVAFASMPKGLHALPQIPSAPDEQAVAEFLALIPRHGPRSFYAGISWVEPGQVVTITAEKITSRRYWHPRGPGPAGADYVEGLRHHLDQATRSRLRGADGLVGSHLSAGYDSAAVTATAARLIEGKVIAFTAVPRAGYDGRSPRGRIGDEGPLAAATAALYPNVEHLLVRSGERSPVADLDRYFHLFDGPTLNLANWVWLTAIGAAASERKLKVMLTGQVGNASLSYHGLELLPDLARRGRLGRVWREGSQLVASGELRWRGVLARTLGPFLPAGWWNGIKRAFGHPRADVFSYTALSRDKFAELGLEQLARQRGLDTDYAPRADAFATRMWVLNRFDAATYGKGALAAWGIDQRDPTADRRLVEYCLGAPVDEFLANGSTRWLARRALADRLPASVLAERRKGYQAVDWHEGLTAARDEVATELERLARYEPAARLLDVERLRGLMSDWPSGGWERPEVSAAYRLALLRGIAAGHFLRKASGSNA